MADTEPHGAVSLQQIAKQWTRIGCLGFGGPPAHMSLLRELCVTRMEWMSASQFERAVAAVNLLPGPASTQLAIYCAWRLRGRRGALLGGVCFIAPGLLAILMLGWIFLSRSAPLWLRGAEAGAGAAVGAVAVQTGLRIAAPGWAVASRPRRREIALYGLIGAAACAFAGPLLVLALLACGGVQLARGRRPSAERVGYAIAAPVAQRAVHTLRGIEWPGLLLGVADTGGWPSLMWTALKVGTLAFGGGFVIVPLMQSDAVSSYHWMTHAQFLGAVALGQVTPGPLTQTVAVVGYAAAGLPGALLASLVAFTPSFCFVLFGAGRFERLLSNNGAQRFLAGAAPAAAGAIVGAAIPLTAALSEGWQLALSLAAALGLLTLRLGVVSTLLGAACLGALAALAGAQVPH
jgi:chromate transporter